MKLTRKISNFHDSVRDNHEHLRELFGDMYELNVGGGRELVLCLCPLAALGYAPDPRKYLQQGSHYMRGVALVNKVMQVVVTILANLKRDED